jgi:TrkA domain protein
MKLEETELPGIGKRFETRLSGGQNLVVVIHNTGKREVYLMEEEEPSCCFELTDEEAKELGFLIAGAVFEPVATEKMELLWKQVVMEWVKVEAKSSYVGNTIAELQIRRKTGVSVIAIERNDRIIPSPDPYKEKIEAQDILVVIGTREQIARFLQTVRT